MRVNIKYTSLPNSQYGVGLLEVLIALLLLAIAALGYASLQAQALKSTDESLTRTQAINLIRDAGESMRVNAVGVTSILMTTNPPPVPPPSAIDTILNTYAQSINAAVIPTEIPCDPVTGCTSDQTAVNDAIKVRLTAQEHEIKLGTAICPGTQNITDTLCLIAAWKDTDPTIGSGEGTYCMTSTGAYRPDADCVYMEAY